MSAMDFIRGVSPQSNLISSSNKGPNYFGNSLKYGTEYSKMLDSGDTGLSEVMRQNLDMGIGFDDSMKLATANRNLASGNTLNLSEDGSGLFGSDWTNSLSDDTFKGVISKGKSLSDNSWSEWFGDKGNQAMIGAGLGLGQLGLGLASYLSQSDFMKKQGKLLDQQLASNQYNIDRQKASDEANRRSYEAAEARRYGTKPTATA